MKLSYDPLRDFRYIGQVLDVPMTLLSRKDFPASNFAELLDYVRKNQDKVSLANAGIGAVSRIVRHAVHAPGGRQAHHHCPTRGAGDERPHGWSGGPAVRPDHPDHCRDQDGQRQECFGVTTPQRLSSLPNIPTLDEQGLKGFDVKGLAWYMRLRARPRRSWPSTKILNVAIRTRTSKAHRRAQPDLVSPEKTTLEGLRTHLQAEVVRWNKVIRPPAFQPISHSSGHTRIAIMARQATSFLFVPATRPERPGKTMDSECRHA